MIVAVYLLTYITVYGTLQTMMNTLVSDDLNLVIDCYVHAITARYPRKRYTPGNSSVIALLVLLWLPTWLVDWVGSRLVIVPEPDVVESVTR